MLKEYFPDKWRAVLRHNKLDTFEQLWSMDVGWFEPPNERRGGWSGVSRCELDLPEGGQVGVFCKRQENHTTRTLRHPFGLSTFAREMQAILRFQKAGVLSIDPVYFAARNVEGKKRAILCTKALDGYRSLEELTEAWRKEGFPDKATQRRMMQAIAKVANRMHDHKIQHNCFYPKHIFLRFDGSEVSVRLIDLEKAKTCPLRRYASFRDLYTLSKHSQHWRRVDHMRFLLLYLGLNRMDPKAKSLWRRIDKRIVDKRRK